MQELSFKESAEGTDQILTKEAVDFLKELHFAFNERRLSLLEKRKERQREINEGGALRFPTETENVRQDPNWQAASTPNYLQKRWVEITGPTDRKMMINALNSGANVFMADFEDANSPTWENMVAGQVNVRDAVRKEISLEIPGGKSYFLNPEHANLFIRPRGWHLPEKHFLIQDEPISASIFDFGLYLFHNGKYLHEQGKNPCLYLPKLESHPEARLWNDLFIFAQNELDIPVGTIRATVLIETISAAFEMEEILYELKEHSAGLNAGRWDYIFSIIKKFRRDPDLLLPDRGQITMSTPFMRAYAKLLVKTCHKRGAHAIGGMAAFIPNRKDPEVTERALRKVREDKRREIEDGFDGTWVAHPDLVPVVREMFEEALKDKPNQKERLNQDVAVAEEDLVNFTIEGGKITEEGLRHNLNVALQYLASWISGTGAAAIYNLMEDAATAEISRAQVWQWVQSGAKTEEGLEITEENVKNLIREEQQKIQSLYGEHYDEAVFEEARKLLEKVVFEEPFIEFLTLPAYEHLK